MVNLACYSNTIQYATMNVHEVTLYDFGTVYSWKVLSRNAIDLYLEPLIDEPKQLWEEGIVTFDAYAKMTFFYMCMQIVVNY